MNVTETVKLIRLSAKIYFIKYNKNILNNANKIKALKKKKKKKKLFCSFLFFLR